MPLPPETPFLARREAVTQMLSPPETAEVATQTPSPTETLTRVLAVVTQTSEQAVILPKSPARGEAVTQILSPLETLIKEAETQMPLLLETPKDSSLQTDPPLAPPTPSASSVRAQAVVIHGVPTRYKPGQVRRWIEEDNEGVEVMGIRWLLKQYELEKVASSLVVYTRSAEEPREREEREAKSNINGAASPARSTTNE
ncbi:hypothetical protein EV426DRAFT_578658 [Tirmania nivea]|nr:hypothetical protein EV426DRAFT_578658 [Tirmania nivea]